MYKSKAQINSKFLFDIKYKKQAEEVKKQKQGQMQTLNGRELENNLNQPRIQ